MEQRLHGRLTPQKSAAPSGRGPFDDFPGAYAARLILGRPSMPMFRAEFFLIRPISHRLPEAGPDDTPPQPTARFIQRFLKLFVQLSTALR